MGVTLDRAIEFFSKDRFPGRRPRVLDIGCSNVHTIAVETLVGFVRKWNDIYDEQSLRQWAAFVESGGVMDPKIGGINGAWLGDVLARSGFDYAAFDIFPGYRTEFFDLNRDELPERHRGAHDVVLNFGTTEHVLGQFNAFKIIHEAAAVGALMYHDLPMTGYLDHGYFCYNPMLFMQLAEANDYNVEMLRFSGVLGGESVSRVFFDKYRDHPSFNIRENDGQTWPQTSLPTASVSVIFRKKHDAEFRAGLETSTTVGVVAGEIGGRYGREKEVSVHSQGVPERMAALLRRVKDPTLSLDEVMGLYNDYIAAGSGSPFPLSLEAAALRLSLAVDPSNAALAERRAVVTDLRTTRYPLLRHVPAEASDRIVLALDGVEDAFDLGAGSAEAVFLRIVEAYRIYDDRLAVELFPAKLEAYALDWLWRNAPWDASVLSRLGDVMSKITPTLAIRKRA
jgi:hypothetical protein